MVTSSALALAFLILILVLAARRSLVPGIIILGSFILWVLWLTGLIGTALQMYGTSANVNANCQNFVADMEYKGPSINTLAWMTQTNICKLYIIYTFMESILTGNPLFLRQLLESSIRLRSRQYRILPLDAIHVMASP